MKNILNNFLIILCLFFTLDLYANEAKEVPVNQSNIILHDGTFEDGLPIKFMFDVSKKTHRWGYGNWNSNAGFANLSFSQMGLDWILHETGMIPKKILKSWSVEDYKLGKKKGFKSSGNRAMVQLVEINNKKCVVIISRFGANAGDSGGRLRSSVDGYICKNSGEITIDQGINYMHCVQLKGEGSNYLGRDIDDKCVKKEITKKIKKTSSETKKSIFLYCKDNEGVYEYMNGPTSCYDNQTQITKKQYLEFKQNLQNTSTNNNESSFEERLTKFKFLFDKKLITKEEYDQKRKEILDQM